MLFRCECRAPGMAGGSGGSGNGESWSRRVVDIHAHRECGPAAEMMRPEAERVGRVGLSYGSELTKEVNRQQLIDLRPKMESVEERLADMDRMGVEVQAVSIAPYQMYYWAEPEIGSEVTRLINDELAETVAKDPERMIGLGTVPLQETGAAIAELERCIGELGFRGLEVGTNVNGEDLSSARLEPFWARVEELGAVVFIHSTGFSHPDRIMGHYFVNVIGHPLEGTLAASHLIFDGVMERHPALKIVMAHGGGYLPAYAARMDHAYHARRDVREGLPKPPGTYLRQFYFDTMVFEPDQLGFLIGKYGADHILLGTDYPYDMGESDPLGLIGRVAGLSEPEVAAIAGGNAARLLGL
ncbi:MAG: amidohydrolase family protein [Acidimicrobiia bacterium]